MKQPARGDSSIRLVPKDLTRGLWAVHKDNRELGLVRWAEAIPFKLAIKIKK